MNGSSTDNAPDQQASCSIHQQALEWQVILWSGEVTTEERAAFQHWLAADDEHAHAWQQIQRMNQQLHVLPDRIMGKVLRAPRPRKARRNVLRALGIVIVSGAFARVASNTPQWQMVMADYHTDRGERRNLTLPDGTHITLNTATAIDVHYSVRQRHILLRTGEVLVTTAHSLIPPHSGTIIQPDPPFVVETAQGSIRALGTRFTVRQEGNISQVAVFEGAVEIRPAENTSIKYRLDAGQQIRFSDIATESPQAASDSAQAWVNGLLIAERMRLDDFLTELARYRNGIIRCDPSVADLIISGVYPLADTDHILATLPQGLPVRVSYVTRYWVTVSTR